jgi:hypothetical protein
MLDARGTELVTRRLSDLLDAAESDQRLPPRLVRRHPDAPVLFGLLLDMEADLVIEPVVQLPSAGERPNPSPDIRERTHQPLLARYAARNANPVLVVHPLNGLAARSAAKKTAD